MARLKHSLVEGIIELTSKLPWWAGVALAIAAYLWLHNVASTDVTIVAQPGQMGKSAVSAAFQSLAVFGQYLLPLAFLVGAAVSAYGRYRRRALHEQVAASPDAGALNAMSWRQFESVVGEAFRRKGYSVAEKGGGGADGGIDLVLKKQGETFLAQCKQWRAVKVGVNIVRELYGVMAARGATGGFVVTSGVFTDEARAFAKGRNIELMDGKALHALIAGVKPPPKFFRDPLSVMTTGAPFCPECQSRMVKRKAKRGANAGQEFWGCTRYPDCKGTRAA
ncbi:restriction endonuclease [Thiobacillus sedimenti]|uniref:Restriction endonuclease n=1 Tax=Thiobacillus sedimenti TaxID=3110231 RepID=A0ABZ1CMR0_9PROT|nr:restriction endonuclease [Thiobacillus sp. SCUT-2]WRS40680.1 restriction endonuclease [Thiobacillus sp. SCUT-2]